MLFNKPLVPLWNLWEPSPGTKPECGIHYVSPSAPCGALIWIPSTQKRALCHCRGFWEFWSKSSSELVYQWQILLALVTGDRDVISAFIFGSCSINTYNSRCGYIFGCCLGGSVWWLILKTGIFCSYLYLHISMDFASLIFLAHHHVSAKVGTQLKGETRLS